MLADLPDVVRVAQQFEERGTPHRSRQSLRHRDGGQSSESSFGQQVGDGVLTGGVGVEHLPDERCAVRVDCHGAVPPTVVIDAPSVAVADWCAGWSTACGGVLCHVFGSFGGEVAGLELRDRGHDAVE